MVKEERLEKHGTHDKYVIRTYDTSTPWIQTKRKDMVYVLSGDGWQIQYENTELGNKLEAGNKFLLPEKVKYKLMNKEKVDSNLVLKIEFI